MIFQIPYSPSVFLSYLLANINGSLFENLHPVPCRISLPGLCDIPFSSLAKQHGMSSVDSVWLHGAACPREAAFFSWCAIEHQKLQTTAILRSYIKYTFPETNSLQLKMDGWKSLVSCLGPGLVSGAMLNFGGIHLLWHFSGLELRWRVYRFLHFLAAKQKAWKVRSQNKQISRWGWCPI